MLLLLLFSLSVLSESLWSHGLQHASLPCPSPSFRVCSNSCPLSQWCHPTVSSSVAPFSSCLQSFSASRFQQWVNPSHQVAKMSELQLPHQSFRWASGLISLTLKSLLQHHSSKASILWCSAYFIVQLSHPYKTTGKTIALTLETFVGKVMSLLFNMLSRLAITFLPRSNCLLI